MAYGHGLGAAYAAAAAMREHAMVCPEDKCEWVGKDLPCWYCGRSGVQKFPPKKETV